MEKQRRLAIDGKFGLSHWKQGRAAQGDVEAHSVPEEEPSHAEIMQRVWNICQEQDTDKKGFITRTDMQKLQADLPWSAKELELLFDGLDDDKKGCIPTEEFVERLRHFLSAQTRARAHRKRKRALTRAPVGLLLEEDDSREQNCFETFINQLGDGHIFEDKAEIWTMWVQLQQNEPHLLGNLKEFLAKMTHLIMEAKQEKEKLELMLKIRVAEHNKEVQRLYEEMEEQIESEKQRLQNESKTRNQLLSMEMKKALDVREQEIQRFLSVQKELEKQFLSLKEKQHVASTETQQLKQANSILENQLEQTLHQLQRTQRHLDAMKDKMAQMYKQGRDRPLEEVSEKIPQRPQDPLHPDEMFSSQLQKGLVRSQSEDILDSSAHQAPDDVASMTKADSQPVTRVISIEEEPLPGTVVEEYYFPPEPSGQNSLFTELNEAIALMNKMSESHTPQINDFGSQEQEPFEQNGNSQRNLMPERAPQNEVLSKNNGLQKMISETLIGNATSQAEIRLKGGPALEMKQTNIFEPRVEVTSSEPVQRRNCDPVVQSLGYSVLVTQPCDHKEGPLQGDTLLLEQVIQPECRNQCPSVDSEKGVLQQSQEMQTPIREIPETPIPPMKYTPSVHFPTKKTLPMLHVRHEHEANISLFQISQLGNSSEMEMWTSEGRGVLLSEGRGERLANASEYKKNQQGRAEKGEQTNDNLEDHSCQGNDTKEAYKDATTDCSHPDHMYNVLFVGDSYVGKTSFLHRFQGGSFIANMTSTVGMDYRIKNLFVDNKYFALCLWDTVGQERYHSLTKQFFRKADGVVLMYDITSEYSFANVRYWLHCIQEGAGKGVIILLLGNKTDCVKERRVSTQDAAYLAKEHGLPFYECSAASGHNVTESMVKLVRLMKIHEDQLKEEVLQLPASPKRKRECCL